MDYYGSYDINKCPSCKSNNIEKKPMKFVFTDNTNPIECTCMKCRYRWQERRKLK